MQAVGSRLATVDAIFLTNCAGKNQSPVNLSGFIKADLKPIKFAYQTAANEILHNGHTLQVNQAAGSKITLDGVDFELQ